MFHIARHLAAKTETNCAAFVDRSSLLYVSHIVERCYFLVFPGKRYCHQVEMISVIKLETCLLICCWLRWLMFRVLAFFKLSWKIW
jgi:hypothetical protein